MNKLIDQLILKITNPTDGPVTVFVMMGRACELATKYNPTACAEALYECLFDANAAAWATGRLTCPADASDGPPSIH